MSPYTHLTLKDRECILLGVTLHHTYQVIAVEECSEGQSRVALNSPVP